MRSILTLLGLLLSLLLSLSTEAGDFHELKWDNLLAPGETATTSQAKNTQHTTTAPQAIGKVNPALNGNAITLPGYAVPLEGDGQTVTAFLLVPFFGACIHVPPPPSNQVVLVRAPSGVPVDDLWDAIKVSGTLHVQDSHHDLANAGYTLDAVTVTPYPN